jgi:hypothetical protein
VGPEHYKQAEAQFWQILVVLSAYVPAEKKVKINLIIK